MADRQVTTLRFSHSPESCWWKPPVTERPGALTRGQGSDQLGNARKYTQKQLSAIKDYSAGNKRQLSRLKKLHACGQNTNVSGTYTIIDELVFRTERFRSVANLSGPAVGCTICRHRPALCRTVERCLRCVPPRFHDRSTSPSSRRASASSAARQSRPRVF